VAVARDGRATVVELGDRGAEIPSVVLLREDGGFSVGEAAERRGVVASDRLAREFKRRIGDPTPVPARRLPAHRARADRRAAPRGRRAGHRPAGRPAGRRDGHPPGQLGAVQAAAAREAVALSGVPSPAVITEPEAAAVRYASLRRLAEGDVVAVYDLGGGTFDAAVLARTSDGFRILGSPAGIEQLGGVDFDDAVFAHVLAALGDRVEQLDVEDPATAAGLTRLRRDCVAAKEALSQDDDIDVPVGLPLLHTSVRITRSELEDLIRPPLLETVASLRRALRSAGVAPEDLTTVLLAGGSSRIPLVAELLSAQLGRPLAVDAHPKHLVALGAATAVGQALPAARLTPPGRSRPRHRHRSHPHRRRRFRHHRSRSADRRRTPPSTVRTSGSSPSRSQNPSPTRIPEPEPRTQPEPEPEPEAANRPAARGHTLATAEAEPHSVIGPPFEPARPPHRRRPRRVAVGAAALVAVVATVVAVVLGSTSAAPALSFWLLDGTNEGGRCAGRSSRGGEGQEGAQVRVEDFPNSSYAEQLAGDLRSEGRRLAELGGGALQTHVDGGEVVDLTDLVQDRADTLLPGTLEPVTFDDAVYGYPMSETQPGRPVLRPAAARRRRRRATRDVGGAAGPGAAAAGRRCHAHRPGRRKPLGAGHVGGVPRPAPRRPARGGRADGWRTRGLVRPCGAPGPRADPRAGRAGAPSTPTSRPCRRTPARARRCCARAGRPCT
jgi:actin-like ATPase involved in cell morphogenesis